MKVGDAIIEILKREGVEVICGYPLNYLSEYAAAADLRTVVTRAERTAGHMADAISRLSSGEKIGVYITQHGPGIENGLGALAQAFAESVPLLAMPMGYPRSEAHVPGNFNATIAVRSFVKSVEPLIRGADVPAVMRRAFSRLRNGRGGPVVVELPNDIWLEDVPEPLDYDPISATRYAPDPAAIGQAVDMLLAAKAPVVYAGQGVHYARAWPQLRELAERLALPVTTSLEGKSAFPEDHPLSLGSGGVTMPRAVHDFLQEADLVFGIGCSFTRTTFGIDLPLDKRTIHATLDPWHLNNSLQPTLSLLGDAALTLDAILAELGTRSFARPKTAEVAGRIRAINDAWLAEWQPTLTSDETPLTPYRVIWDLVQNVDIAKTIITHDAGSPRDQLSPFWACTEPLSYIGWGKTTQLGYGLGLAMGAKLAQPEKLCINVWGDAAFGFTGLELETAVRERIPVLSILFNNFSMAMETPAMGLSHEKFGTMDISGDYTALARSLGAHGERVTRPEDIVPAIRRAIVKTEEGVPALLEFITKKELSVSRHSSSNYYNPPVPLPNGKS